MDTLRSYATIGQDDSSSYLSDNATCSLKYIGLGYLGRPKYIGTKPFGPLQMHKLVYAIPTLINLQQVLQFICSECLASPYEFEPVRPTIFLIEEPLPIRKASLDAALALG